MSEKEFSSKGDVTRRQFLTALGAAGVGVVVGGVCTKAFFADEDVMAIEVSGGYLLVDTKKCAGCESCMIACTMAHQGCVNQALARIQIVKNPFKSYPYDMTQNQCRQCVYPSCAEACPVSAIGSDPETGARIVHEEKCIGCTACMSACPFTPSRMQWDFINQNAQKCDLCIDTPHWNKQGGVDGGLACVEICPMKALAFSSVLPEQTSEGYDVNLRNQHYAMIGLPIDDAGMVPADISLKAE